MNLCLSVKQSLAIFLLQVYLNPQWEIVEVPILPLLNVCVCLINLSLWEQLPTERQTLTCRLTSFGRSKSILLMKALLLSHIWSVATATISPKAHPQALETEKLMYILVLVF